MNRLFGMDSPLMVALMKIGDLLCLSVLWLVFSLPIFTIGASSTAARFHAYSWYIPVTLPVVYSKLGRFRPDFLLYLGHEGTEQ